MQSTGFALGVISFACPPLNWSTAGPHSFQELMAALLVRWGWKTLSIACTALI